MRILTHLSPAAFYSAVGRRVGWDLCQLSVFEWFGGKHRTQVSK
ncbi:MAG TPA: hypothetical protein VHS31_01035 [Tepidisphaeraceae bacterium]|nr:hypothetical protein [Tepidisphaeraceae bacterium]